MLTTPSLQPTAPLDAAWIAAHIPHQGSMCLLEAVSEWSPTAIRCRASSHRDPANPLRADGRLGIACGIEYAAQAMAVHGALLAMDAQRPRAGYLVSVRNVSFGAERLDGIAGDLAISAERLSGDDTTVLYQFEVRAANPADAPADITADHLLLSGRAAAILDSEK